MVLLSWYLFTSHHYVGTVNIQNQPYGLLGSLYRMKVFRSQNSEISVQAKTRIFQEGEDDQKNMTANNFS